MNQTRQYKFLDSMPPNAHKPSQPSFLRITNSVLPRAHGLQFLTLQSIHVTRALLHLMVSLEQSTSATDAIRTYLTSRDELQDFEDRLEDLFDEISSDAVEDTIHPLHRWQSTLDDLFNEMCTGREGAIDVAQSQTTMRLLKEIDWRSRRNQSGRPDTSTGMISVGKQDGEVDIGHYPRQSTKGLSPFIESIGLEGYGSADATSGSISRLKQDSSPSPSTSPHGHGGVVPSTREEALLSGGPNGLLSFDTDKSVDANALGALEESADLALKVWTRLEELFEVSMVSSENGDGIGREYLMRARDLTVVLKSNIQAVLKGAEGEGYDTVLWEGASAFSKDVSNVLKYVIKLFNERRIQLEPSLRTELQKLSHSTQEFLTFLASSSFAAGRLPLSQATSSFASPSASRPAIKTSDFTFPSFISAYSTTFSAYSTTSSNNNISGNEGYTSPVSYDERIAQLEASLIESEQKLRKARTQATELVRERDNLSHQLEATRTELEDAKREVVNVRMTSIEEKQWVEKRLDEERRAKERARAQLDSRMEELVKRKSKYACM